MLAGMVNDLPSSMVELKAQVQVFSQASKEKAPDPKNSEETVVLRKLRALEEHVASRYIIVEYLLHKIGIKRLTGFHNDDDVFQQFASTEFKPLDIN